MSQRAVFGWEWNLRDAGVGIQWSIFPPEWWIVALNLGPLHLWMEKA